ALWVTAANFFLAKALLENKRWLPILFAAAAMALAFISKGPVSLLQTLLHFAFFAIFLKQKRQLPSFPHLCLLPALVGTPLFPRSQGALPSSHARPRGHSRRPWPARAS